MATAKILVSMPEELASRLKAAIPSRKRSGVLRLLIESEVEKREKRLYEAACAVEKDMKLNAEMKDWDITTGDGIDDETG